jgi:hypothetical protein
MDVLIGLDRPSMRTNVLIHARADVGRARETLIYAPARIQASDVVFGRPGVAADARDTARDALRWRERVPETSTDAVTGAMDLVAMNKAATSAKCATSAEVRKFRRDAEDPVRLRARRRRPETPPRDLDATHGRPSHLRDADELRHACGTTSSTTVRSLIEGEYARDWIDARRVGGDANRRRRDDDLTPPTRRVVDARRDVARARERTRERDALARAAREKVPFKMKKFTRATPRVSSH